MERSETKKLVVKIGSSTITNGNTKLDSVFIFDIARQVAMIRRDFDYEVAIVSSGAVASGRLSVSILDQGIVDTQVAAMFGQQELMFAWSDAFRKFNIRTAQALYNDEDLNQAPPALLRALQVGVPVINANDAVDDREIKQLSVARDNDRLAGFVARAIRADFLVLLTDVNGVLDKKGDVLPLVGKLEDIEDLIAGKSRVGTGGMWSKVNEAKYVAREGTVAVIANGREENVLLRILQGKTVGTRFLPGFMLY